MNLIRITANDMLIYVDKYLLITESGVTKVVPREGLLEEALSHDRMMAKKSFGALKLTKRALDHNKESN